MLTGAQLATAITAVLVAAIALGWVLHWIWARLGSTGSESGRLAEMLNRLHEADRAREVAERARELAENLLAAREAEMEPRLAELQARLQAAIESRGADLPDTLRESPADAEASTSELRRARRRIVELEAELEALRREEGI